MKCFKTLRQKNIANPKSLILGAVLSAGLCTLIAIYPNFAFASVEGSLSAVQAKLVGTILPLAAICGLVMAGFSFVLGHQNARNHLVLAIIGAIVGFGAESIVALIRSLIH